MAQIPQSVKRKDLIPSFTEPANLAFRQVNQQAGMRKSANKYNWQHLKEKKIN